MKTSRPRRLATVAVAVLVCCAAVAWVSLAESPKHHVVLLEAENSTQPDNNVSAMGGEQTSPPIWRRQGVAFMFGILLVFLVCLLYYGCTHWFQSNGEVSAHAHPKDIFKVPASLKGLVHAAASKKSDDKSSLMAMFSEPISSVSALTMSKSPLALISSGLSPKMLGLLVLVWLVSGTAIVSLVARWPPGQAFFFIVNTGLGRGFTAPVPLGADSAGGQAMTVLNELVGAVLFGAALAFLIDTLLEKIRGDATDAVAVRCADDAELHACFSQVSTGGPYKTIAVDTTHDGFVDGIGVDTTGDGYVDTVLVKRPAVLLTRDRVTFAAALAAWIALGVAYGTLCEGYSLPQAAYFAFTTLGMGGLATLGTDGPGGFLPEPHAWALGAWVLVGVPLFAGTAASFAGFLLEKSVRQRERAAIDAAIPAEDFEIASRIIQPDDALDRAEFVLLELLRMGKTDVATIALIFHKFDEIDAGRDGRVDMKEILAYNAHFAALQGRPDDYPRTPVA